MGPDRRRASDGISCFARRCCGRGFPGRDLLDPQDGCCLSEPRRAILHRSGGNAVAGMDRIQGGVGRPAAKSVQFDSLFGTYALSRAERARLASSRSDALRVCAAPAELTKCRQIAGKHGEADSCRIRRLHRNDCCNGMGGAGQRPARHSRSRSMRGTGCSPCTRYRNWPGSYLNDMPSG